MNGRFTVDGTPELEGRLESICERVRVEATALLPRSRGLTVALGGGYGRGEGGVLRTERGDEPYNDMEFYVFPRGNRVWKEMRHGRELHDLGERLSREFSLQVEFKVDGAERWKKGPPSMFSYDLASKHRVVCGEADFLGASAEQLDASAIPLSEATRLMFNRCSGLLLAGALLRKGTLSGDEADFVGRNLAKMQLALGDAALTALGKYHWSARERNRRLDKWDGQGIPGGAEIVAEHGFGLEFKLHPRRIGMSVEEFLEEHRRLSGLARQMWLWLENRRLRQRFLSSTDYALSAIDKCPETAAWRNVMVNMRGFGPKTLVTGAAWRYPRGRLFNALTLLLWDVESAGNRPLLRKLQRDLHSEAADWTGLVGAFKEIWPRYG